MPAAPPADPTRIRALLGPAVRWADIACVDETGSTNKDLAAAARGGATMDRVLVADHQTAGRGRFDRRWVSPQGSSLSVSALFRPTRPGREWGWLSILVGMAATEAIAGAIGEGRVSLKWPNDVLVDGLKVCGILSERVEAPGGPAAVVGIGINTHLGADELPVPTATSLLLAGFDVDKSVIVAGLLASLEQLLALWEGGGDVRDAYRVQCSSIGRRLRVIVDPETSLSGVGTDIDEQGRLVVRLDEGGERAFAAGDVVHLR